MTIYGSRDSGNFSYSHLQNVPYYTQIDSVTGEITLKSTTVADPNVEGAFVPSTSVADDRSIGTIDPQTGTFTPTDGSGTSSSEGDFFSSPEGIKSVKESATIVANKSQQALGVDPSEATANTLKLLWPNKATTGDDTGDSSTPIEAGSAAALDAVFGMFGSRGGTRNRRSHGNLVFPEALRSDDQDVIKFKMVKFRPRKFDVSGSNMSGLTSKAGITDSMIMGTCVLPIPGGISDSNSVNWGEQTMTSAQAMAGALASKALEGDGSGISDAITKNAESIKKAVKAEVVKAATGTDSAQYLARTEGAVMNPNMELLFGGPQLRSFGFTFKFSPRSAKEAKTLIKVIRFFKQGMAAQKKDNGLFLQAPYTWVLEYLHKGRSHKYLNQFKECAMQSFNVNYTPDGNYFTFRDGEITAYKLTMGFGELEPIFANDYADDGDSSIGY